MITFGCYVWSVSLSLSLFFFFSSSFSLSPSRSLITRAIKKRNQNDERMQKATLFALVTLLYNQSKRRTGNVLSPDTHTQTVYRDMSMGTHFWFLLFLPVLILFIIESLSLYPVNYPFAENHLLTHSHSYRSIQLLLLLLLILSLVLLFSSSLLFLFPSSCDMEGDVVLLGLMDWNAAGSAATQLIPLPTTTEVCYELMTGGVCIYKKNNISCAKK